MAAPVFFPDLDTLRSRLRLLETVGEEGAAVLSQAISEVRVGLFDALGASLVSTILESDWDADAATEPALTRLRAANLEYAWVRFLLLQRQPSMFVEFNTGSVRQTWNEQGIVREISQTALNRMLDELWRSVQSGILRLLSTTPDTSGFAIETIGPTTTPQRPFDSIADPDYLTYEVGT